jgi:hypothetical protein
MKKLVGLLLTIIMVLGLSMTALASDITPVLSLEKNEYNSNGERHIKVAWTGKSGTYQIQLDDDINFGNPLNKRTTNKYWNFVLDENVDSTYYIRVRLATGKWSEVVIAEGHESTISTDNAYLHKPNIPNIPNISGSVKLPQLYFRGYTFPTITIKK